MFSLSRRNVLSTTLVLIACSMALLLTVARHTSSHAAPLAQTNGQNLQVIENVGGATREVVVEGNYAYVIVNNRLDIVDISNPLAPIAVGSLGIGYQFVDMAIAEDMLYIGGGYSGFHIISVSDPHYPIEVGQIPSGWAGHVAAQGHYVYWGGLSIVDAARPASPIQVGAYQYAGDDPLITVQGNYAYLLGWSVGDLEIIDVSNPSNPQFVGSVAIPTSARTDLVVVDKTIYVSYKENVPNQSGNNHLLIIDASNPLEPKQKGEYVPPITAYLLGSLAVAGNYLYWGGNWSVEGIFVLDVTDPEHIVLEQTLNVVSNSLVIAQNRLYSASPQEGLQIYDLSLPSTPSLISSYNAGGILGTNGYDGTGMRIHNNFLYAAGHGRMQVHDLTNPIPIVSSVNISGSLFTIENQTAYLVWSDVSCFGFHAVDIANPLSLTLMHTYQLGCIPNEQGPNYIQAITNGRLYASNDWYNDKLFVYDITTLDMPTLLGTYEPSGGTIIVNGNYAYMSNRQYGMTILDVSKASAPTFVANYDPIFHVAKFAISNHYLFARIDRDGDGLRILDIANPIAPVEIGNVPSVRALDFAIEDDYVYLLDLNRGLHIFDIEDPIQPIEVAFDSTIDGTQLVVTPEHRLFVTTYGGLVILRLSGTTVGKVVDSFGKPHAGIKVTLSNGQTTETNVQGDYSFVSLTPGNYTVKAESSTYDFQPAEQTLRVPSYSSEATNFTLLLKPLSTTVTPDSPTHLSYTDLGGNVLDFDLPAGVVAQATTLSVLPEASTAAPGQFSTGVRFDLQTSEARSVSRNFTFTAPLTITIHYTDSAVAPVTDSNQLMLRWWNGSQWTDATTTCAAATPALHDLESRVLTTTVCQSGQFALFGPTIQHFLPLISRSQQVATAEMRGHFVAQHSDKCLNVLEESQQNGANLDQMPCDNRDSEIWTVRPQGEYAQLAAKHSQKCLRVESQVEGAPVIQWSCTGADAELWRLVSIDSTGSSGNTFWLVNKHGGLCLTVQDASQEDRAQVIQSSCSESPNQTWRFQAQN